METEVKLAAYLIRKSGAWYRPNSAGYTTNIAEAGRYTLAEAEAITHPNGPDGPRDNMSYEPAPVVDDLAERRHMCALNGPCSDNGDGCSCPDASPPIKAGEAELCKPYVKRNPPGHAMDGGEVVVPFRTDFEMQCILSALASPHQPEAYGVRVKPLEWSSEAPYGVARVPKLGLMYSTEAIWYEGVFESVELLGSASGRFPTVAAARTAAQADYEARILSALSHTEQGTKP